MRVLLCYRCPVVSCLLKIQAGLIVRDIFRFNVIWHRQSVAALNVCRRLAERDVAVTPSATCVDWLRWWYKHAARIVSPSTTLAFVARMCEKRKSNLPSSIQVKNWRKTEIRRKKPIWKRWMNWNVRIARCSIRTFRGNVGRIKESAKPVSKVFVCRYKGRGCQFRKSQ